MISTSTSATIATPVTVGQFQSAVTPATTCPVPDAKIVVVDDEPVNIKVVSRLLRIEGYTQFVSTADARGALSLIQEQSPDAVLLDLMMPYVSGLDILAAMRQHEATRHTPVIILTASTDQATREEALRGGANDFLNSRSTPVN